MIILALDTATPVVSCALHGPGGVIGELTAAGGRRHGEILAPAIERLCREQGVPLAELGAVAVDRGPGLFTGLRVGVATAKALASALRVPLVGVTSLEALAHPHRNSSGLIAPVVDIRRGEVAWALFETALEKEPTGCSLAERRPPEVVSPADLVELLAGLGTEVLVAGDGALRYASELDGLAGVELAGPQWCHPTAAAVAARAAEALACEPVTASDGRAMPMGLDLTPLYLRAADVRIGWVERDHPDPVHHG